MLLAVSPTVAVPCFGEPQGAGPAASPAAQAPDPNGTRMFIAPTARTLPRGDVLISAIAAFPLVQVGVTDRVEAGMGTLPVFSDSNAPPLVFTAKVQVSRRPSTQASVGVLHFAVFGEANLGIAYGVVTHGTADNAVTMGGGYVYVHSGGEVGRAPVAIAGAERRLNRRVKAMVEGYFFDGGGLVTGGLRLMRRRFSADLGLMAPFTHGHFIVAPVVTLAWRLGD
jgi:hypothetical protein